MIGGDDLGKSFGLGAVGFVAAGADDRRVELRRFYGCRIVGMFGLGPVAGFARDDHMPALLLQIDYVGVAGLANIMAGESHRAGCDLSNSIAAIVPVLSKAARDDDGSQGNESDQGDRHNNNQPNEMFDVFEQVVRRTLGGELR